MSLWENIVTWFDGVKAEFILNFVDKNRWKLLVEGLGNTLLISLVACLIGILLGRGLDIDEARAQLNGVTLESLTVAVRVARAVKVRAERGEVDLADYPLLMHIDDILQKHAPVDIPWEQFTFVKA